MAFRALWLPLWYPTPEAPHRNVWARELARAVADYGEVKVLHVAEGATTSEILEEGIETWRVGYRQGRYRWVTPYLRAAFSRAVTLRHTFPFELVHAHCAFPAGLAGMLIAAWFRVPLVLTEHWGPYDQLMGFSRLSARAIRTVVRSASAVLAVSTGLRREIEEWTGRHDIEIAPPTVDGTRFHLSVPRARVNGRTQVLFTGDLGHARKRLEDLLSALEILHRESPGMWGLDVVGDGALRAEYEATAHKLGIADYVVFHGDLALDGVADAMRRCDIFAMPSTYETFGAVYVEALASGKPVVATLCGGPEDFVTTDLGRLVPPLDVPALAWALREVGGSLDGFPAEHLRSAALERFSHEVVGRLHERLYARVLRSRYA